MTSTAHTPGPALSSCPPSAPSLLLPTFPGAALLVTSPDTPGSKLIIKLKREGPLVGNTEEMPRTQTFFLTGMPLGWTTQRRDGPPGPGIRTVLLTKAGEEPGGRKPRVPEAVPSVRAPPPSDSSFACTSKGVYENYRRWQRYKALARRHFPATPDAEALACFFIPVLRSLARLRPDMTLEDGVPRAVQEWEHSSNFERMIFYEMAEKFMEFEAEEEQQIQKMKLLAGCSQFQTPAPKPTKLPVSPAPESGQQQVYIPKKSACKSRQPRRRQRRPPSTSTPGTPQEIPAEAVHQYAEIMEGLETAWEEEEEEKKEPGASKDHQGQEDGIFPDPSLLQYIDQLCDDEEFVCKAEAVIHPQFMAYLLSPEKSQDPLDLLEELDEELHLTPSQLMEKRLLALTEEEKDPSVYPTSHSDSTPSLSEEEDEANGHGKGEGPSCRSTKRSSLNKGFRSCQTELPSSVSHSPQPSHLYPQMGDRRFPSKGVRTVSRPSPHKCSSSNTQEATLLPPLKNTVEEETQNSQAGGPTIEMAAHAQCVQFNVTLDITGNNIFTRSLTSQGRIESRQEIVRLPTTEHSKQNDTQERKAKVREEVPKATEQGSHALNRTLLVRNSLQSAHNKCRKQDGIQPREVKCLKKAQTMWIDVSKEMDQSRDVNKIVLVDPTAGQSAEKLTLNGHREQNVDSPEKIRGRVYVQERRGSEAISNKAPLGSQVREITSHWDSHIKPGSQEVTQLKCGKEYGHQREVLNDQNHFQSIRIGTKCNPTVTTAQLGNVKLCGQILSRQSSPTLATSGTGNKPSDQITKAESQKQSQVDQKQNKATTVKDKSTKLPAGKLPLQKQLLSARQNDQPSGDLPLLETDPKANLKANVESSKRSGQHLALSDPSGIGVFKCQPPGVDLEQLPCSSFSVLESSSLSIQTGLEASQTQPLLTDQCTVIPSMEVLSDKQTLNPTLMPSSFLIMVEADGGSCGQSGDHISGPTITNKVIPVPAQLTPQKASSNSSHDKNEPNSNLHPSEVRGSCHDMKVLNELENRSVLENVPVAKVRLPDLTEAGLEEILKHSAKVQEEEDEELSSFSSLLATKLSLSPYHNHGFLPMDQGDTHPSFPTETGQQGAKTRPSTRGKMPQDTSALPSKHLEANPTTHRCCSKRKSSSSGTRRSKRLRNQ